MPRTEEPEDQALDKDDPVAPPGSGKRDPEAAQRAEDEMERERGGPEDKAVDNAREQLTRLRERD